MDLISVFFIAVALAMDCFAVSISTGICSQNFKLYSVVKLAFFFAFFQGLMPLISFFSGQYFAIGYLNQIDHWVAFIILSFIGLKMIRESLSQVDNNQTFENPFDIKTLFLLSIATSIDALATGIVFIPFKDFIFWCIAIIFFTTFVFSILGVFIGVKFGNYFSFKFELVGGVILIFIGTKILIEDLFFNLML